MVTGLTILLVSWAIASALTTLLLICACIVSGRHSEQEEQYQLYALHSSTGRAPDFLEDGGSIPSEAPCRE